MARRNQLLLDLIAGRVRPAVKVAAAPVSLSGLIRDSMCKRARALGESFGASQHRYAQSIADTRARQQQEAAAAKAYSNPGKQGLTGDKYYDSLPDVAAKRVRDQMMAIRNRAIDARVAVKRKDLATTKAEVGSTGSWGGNKIMSTLGSAISLPFQAAFGAVDSVGTGVKNLWNGRNISEGQADIWKNVWRNANAVGHDVANNVQLQAEAARSGAQTIGEWALRGLDPSAYGDSLDAEASRRSHANYRANNADAHMARADNIVNNFQDSDLAHPERSTLGAINYGLNHAIGEFAGAEAATAGAGAVAKGAAKGIHAGTQALSNAVRGAEAASAATNAAGAAANTAAWGARAMQGARNMAAKGIDAMGDTIAMPFDMAGKALNPVNQIGAVKDMASGSARNLWQAGRVAVGRPVKSLYNAARSPAGLRGSARYAVEHPWQSAKAVGQYGVDIARPFARSGWGATKSGLRNAFSDNGFKAWAAYDAGNNMVNGDYAGAAGAIGDMGMYGALGKWYLPYMFGKSLYDGFAAPQDMEPGEY